MNKGLKTVLIALVAILLIGSGLLLVLTDRPEPEDPFASPVNEFEEYVEPIIRENDEYVVTVYVPNKEGTALEKKTETYKGEGLDVQEAIFEDVFVSSPGVTLPSGVKVNGMKIWNETLHIDLSSDVGKTVCTDEASERVFLASIVNSLLGSSKQFTDVQFLVDGERVENLLGHTNTMNPLAFQ